MESNKADMFAANAQRMQVVMNRLNLLLRAGNKSIQQIEQPLLALARGIDFSVANGEVPSKAHALSLLVKQICQWKDDSLILPLIMALMVSVKNACKLGWFSAADTEEIIDLYKEISSSFCLPGNIDDGLSPSNPHIQKIMDRFYPRLSLGKVIACLEVKPGYGAYLVDFHISKNAGFLPQEKIRLFVAQTDNTETSTSSCLISPQQVNFLLNGKGVIGRVNCASMDTGPQIPTNVTALLKFGTNLLQAVGHFTGNYVIAIAFMGVISLSTSDLKDYVQPGVTTQNSDSDSDLIVGPSRVSLNCPISCKRIKTPVKGHSCKHIQCFDFDNYVEINSRRPSWRCPHCNQCISFLDIRRDQNMVKILNEVEDHVQDVIISPDGSWKAATRSDGHTDGSGDTDINHQKGSELIGISNSSGATHEILDLTMGGDMMDMDHISDTEDRKPSHNDLLNSMGSDERMQPDVSTSNQVNQSTCSQIDDFWSGLNLQNLGPSNDRFDVPLMTNTFHPSDRAPGITNAMNPCTTQEPSSRNHLSSHGAVDMASQQLLANSFMNHQFQRTSSVPAIISGTPIATQPHAATSRTPSFMSSGLGSVAFNADRSTTNYSEVGRQQEYSRSALNHSQRPELTSYQSQLQSMGADSRSALNHSQRPELTSYQSQLQSMGVSRDPRQFHSSAAFNPTSASISNFSNSLLQQQQLQQQQQLHQQLHQIQQQYLQRPTQTARLHQQSHYQQTRAEIGASNSSISGNMPTQHIMTSSPASQPLRHPHTSASYQNPTFRPGQSFHSSASAPGMSGQQPRATTVQQVSRTEHLVNVSADPNLRPAGRMRGSLSGRAYEDARNQFLSPSMQQTRPPRPPQDLTSPPPGVPPELHEMITNLSAPPSSAPRA